MMKWLISPMLALALVPTEARMTLDSPEAKVSIDPATLAVDWSVDGDWQPANAGTTPHEVAELTASANQMRWHWPETGVQLSAQLREDTLHLRLQASQPMQLEWFRLPAPSTAELLLPLGEGVRIPLDQPDWATHLVDGFGQLDTTEGLSLPLWTQRLAGESRPSYLSWVLTQPFDNTLTFHRRDNRLTFTADHQFTTLNLEQPFEVQLKPGDTPLSGALAYRDWRESQGMRRSLAAKREQQPNIDKLIGASQVYLFGPGPLAVADVTDWWGLKNWLLSTPALADRMNEDAQQTLSDLNRTDGWFSNYHRQLLVDEINALVEQHLPFSGALADEDYLDQQYRTAQARLDLLANAAGRFLAPRENWGGALSVPGVETLKASGLERLWLGLNSWVPALYQPQAVARARQAGYLIAAYDSYNTAIPPGVNDSWLTAQIPAGVRDACAIIRADGSPQPGFRNQGAYLNPGCGQRYVKNRMQRLEALTGLNSLFLDADAAGMVRQDHHPDRPMNQAAMAQAFNERLNWASEELNGVLGSEGGHAVTSQAIAYAQGPQSRVFAWLDKEVRDDKSSPYYLGRWYPAHRPEVFFKPVPLKPTLYEVLFNPRYRVPLYQAVFHDEVVSGHHWHADSLKFPQAQAARDLTAMLYNVPPMVHLSRQDLERPGSDRLKALMHYEDGFLPVHRALWNQALVGFASLTEDRQVQRTRFSDGSTLTANFDCRPRRADGQTLPPFSLSAQLGDQRLVWQSLAIGQKSEQFGCQPPNS